jgi:hypothetical protein
VAGLFQARQVDEGLHRPSLGKQVEELIRCHGLPTQRRKSILEMVMAKSNKRLLNFELSAGR